MSQNGPSVFLERQSYRRRRLMDGARLLPIIGAALFMVPLLWPKVGDENLAAEPVKTSTAMIYVFGIWALLIVLAAVFSLFARRWRNTDSPHGQPSRHKAPARSFAEPSVSETDVV